MSPSSSINCESFWSSKRPQIVCSVFLTLNQLFQSNCLFNMDERIYEFFKIIKIILQVQDAVSSETSDKLSSQFRKFVSLLVVFRPLLHIFHHKKGKRQCYVVWNLYKLMKTRQNVNRIDSQGRLQECLEIVPNNWIIRQFRHEYDSYVTVVLNNLQ